MIAELMLALSSDRCPAKKWLLIYDNVEDPDLLLNFLPPAAGPIITTSRSKHAAVQRLKGCRTLELNPLNKLDSLTLFQDLQSLYYPEANVTEEKQEASILMDYLDGLPLGIEQLAAYVGTGSFTLKQVIEKYDRATKTILINRGASLDCIRLPLFGECTLK